MPHMYAIGLYVSYTEVVTQVTAAYIDWY